MNKTPPANTKKVQKIIDKIRPYIQMHQGDVELLEVSGETVRLKISGACAHCQLTDLTYKKIVGSLIMKEVPSIKKIELEV